MKQIYSFRALACLLALAPLTACGAMFGGGKPDNLFRFGVPEREGAPLAVPSARQRPIALDRIRFALEIEGDRILTSRGESVLYLKDARWAAAAPDLFTQFDQRASGIRLVPTRERIAEGMILRLGIDRFEARYAQGAGKDAAPMILVSGTANLIDPVSRQPVAAQRFSVEEPATANGKAAIAAAFDRAVLRYTVQIVDWSTEAATRTPLQGDRNG